MTVPALITDLSSTIASNSPAGSDSPVDGDNFLRALSAFIAQLRDQLNGTSSTGTVKNATVSGTLTISSSGITWSGNPTHTGAHTWSGIQTYSANPAGTIIGAAYTPTATAISNVTSITVQRGEYRRIGDFVEVVVYATVTPTIDHGGQFYLTLPIPSAFTNVSDAVGSINQITQAYTMTGGVQAEVPGGRLNCLFDAAVFLATPICVRANYKII